MQVQHRIPCLLFLFILGAAPHRMMAQTSPGDDPGVTSSSRLKQVEITGEQLRDKIRGGMLGQMLGNLNGLVHEMEYIHEPGQVTGTFPNSLKELVRMTTRTSNGCTSSRCSAKGQPY